MSKRRKPFYGHALSERMELPDLKRFLGKFKKVRRGRWLCWEWQGYCDKKGYGQFKWKGKARWVARLSIVNLKGQPILEGMDADHRCRNSRCGRPEHLRQRSRSWNARDGSRHRHNGGRRVQNNGTPRDASPVEECDIPF